MKHSERGVIESAAWGDSGRLAAGLNDGTVAVWDLNPAVIEKAACSRVYRNLTLEEWRQYIPEKQYHQTCPNLPDPRK